MKKSVFLFFMVLFLASEVDGQTVIPVKENLQNEKTINLSEIASDIRFVPLETTDDCLLGGDCYIQYADGQIFGGLDIL